MLFMQSQCMYTDKPDSTYFNPIFFEPSTSFMVSYTCPFKANVFFIQMPENNSSPTSRFKKFALLGNRKQIKFSLYRRNSSFKQLSYNIQSTS